MTYIQAWSDSPLTVSYRDETGTVVIRVNGSRSWRNCNPGNIRPGSFTDLHGSIGNAGNFAVFPDEQTGHDAIVALLKVPTYQKLSVLQAFAIYAPSDDGNRPADYANSVSQRTGLPVTKMLSACTDDELEQLANAITVQEGWTVGDEHPAGVTADPFGLAFPAAAVVNLATGVAARFVYEQTTGRLFLSTDRGNDLIAQGYSGSSADGGLNNPAAQCEKDTGPLPRSTYLIGAPMNGPSPYSLPLTPLRPAEICGRGGFFIHGDSIAAPGTASHGCIILSRPDRQRIVESKVSTLQVVDQLA